MDPRYIPVRFIHVNTREDPVTHVQVQSQSRMYNMFIDKNATVLDLRQQIAREFGFEVAQILIYSNYQLIKDLVYIQEIQGFAIDEDMFFVITLGQPQIPFKEIIRLPTPGIRMADVMALNCRSGARREPMGSPLRYGSDF